MRDYLYNGRSHGPIVLHDELTDARGNYAQNVVLDGVSAPIWHWT